MRKLTSFLGLFILSAVFIFFQINFSRSESLTWDETGHFREGFEAIVHNNFTISPNSPTFILQLLVLPNVWGLNNFLYSRLMVSVLALLLALLIYCFSLFYFNRTIAFLSVFFFLFEPLVLSNSHYITLDIGFSLFFFLAYYLLVSFFNKPAFLIGAVTGFTVGLSISSKATSIGFFAVIAVMYFFINLKTPALKNLYIKSFLKMLVFGLFVLIGIWFTYRFTFGTLGGFTKDGNRLSNRTYEKIRNQNEELANLYVNVLSMPLPLGDFPRILKNAFVFNMYPKSGFLLGKTRIINGTYFIPLMLIKEPLLYIFLSLTGFYFLRRHKAFFPIIIPIMSIFLFMMISKIDLRLRYMLPAYPFIAILCAYSFTEIFKKFPLFRVNLILLFLVFLVSVYNSFPHPISYISEIGGIFGKPYLLVSDSNLDWGQGLIALDKYVRNYNIGRVNLSYYGSDDPNFYGFKGFLKENICKKTCTLDHTFTNANTSVKATAISVTNWQECGFYKMPEYRARKVSDFVGGSILVFRE